MAKYLVDTCVWRDFFQNRISKKGNPLGKFASDFFSRIIKRKDKILFSKLLVKELRRDLSNKEINERLGLLMSVGILERIDLKDSELSEAQKLSETRTIPLFDCIFAVQARNHEAVMVTQDRHYFNDLTDVVRAVRPQDIT